MRHCIRGFAGLVCLIVVGSLHAQIPRDISLDATLGGGHAFGGGELRHRSGVALDAFLSVRNLPASSPAFIVALSAGYQGYPIGDDVCQFGSHGQCVDDFPGLSYVGILAGVEAGRGTGASPGASISLMAGPTFVSLHSHNGNTPDGKAAGLQARADAATATLGPLALIASVRGALVPRFRGQTLAAWTLGFGLRLR